MWFLSVPEILSSLLPVNMWFPASSLSSLPLLPQGELHELNVLLTFFLSV